MIVSLPEDIISSHICSFLDIYEKNIFSGLSRFHHKICKPLDKGGNLLPRFLRIMLLKDDNFCGTYESLSRDFFITQLSSSTLNIPISNGIRTWEPNIDFEFDVGDIFNNPGNMGIRFSFLTHFTGPTVKETRAVVSIRIITFEENIGLNFKYYIGWCEETKSTNKTFLIGTEKDGRIIIHSAFQNTENIRIPITSITSSFLDIENPGSEFFQFLKGNRLRILLFGVQEQDKP